MYNDPLLEKKNHNINSSIYGTSYINKINPDKQRQKTLTYQIYVKQPCCILIYIFIHSFLFFLSKSNNAFYHILISTYETQVVVVP